MLCSRLPERNCERSLAHAHSRLPEVLILVVTVSGVRQIGVFVVINLHSDRQVGAWLEGIHDTGNVW